MAEKQCPLLRSACIEHGCRWYTHLTGTLPQSGEVVDKFGCAIEWLPVLLVENAKETRQTAAAVESARNEQAKGVAALANALTTRDVGGRVLEMKR